ncbi:hypothetical protein ABDD95_21945 [Mucilaginibacter sp. PAMB04274]|uniref:hypothetical protein n=1 Tax=Mucilaginibacter sp. PAMB04274 TaxID=3138568 RepID=UPI0031F63ED2
MNTVKIIALPVLLLLSFGCHAQHVADTFQNAEQQGYSMMKLDKAYGSALDADSTKAVFKGQKTGEFIKAYTQMLNNLQVYLNQHGFIWDKPTRIFNRIYFEPDGSISYYLVNLKTTSLNEEKQKQFVALLKDFIQNYKINITGNTRFAQCSPVLYQNSK